MYITFCTNIADTGKVDLTMNVVERVSGGISAGGGISSGYVMLQRAHVPVLFDKNASLITL